MPTRSRSSTVSASPPSMPSARGSTQRGSRTHGRLSAFGRGRSESRPERQAPFEDASGAPRLLWPPRGHELGWLAMSDDQSVECPSCGGGGGGPFGRRGSAWDVETYTC